MSFKLMKSLIDDDIDSFVEEYSFDEDEAFAHWFYNLIYDKARDNTIPDDEFVDGSDDKQIDVFKIEVDESANQVFIDILQVKNTEGFSGNIVTLMKAGLDLTFHTKRNVIRQNTNKRLVEKILEAKELILKLGSQSVHIRCLYVTRGNQNDVPDEVMRNREAIQSSFDNGAFGSFTFELVGIQELHRLSNLMRSANRRVSYDLPIDYDSNRSSVIEFSLGGVKSLLCTVRGNELAKLAQSEPRDAVFDKNVRKSLGFLGAVNKNIYQSATDPELAQKFWFMNNGITMVCDGFDAVKDSDNPIVKIMNLQIINGCQTTSTIRKAFEDGKLDENVLVQLKLYASKDDSFVSKVVIATNNQNSIGSRDLCANDEIQSLIQQSIANEFGLFYERKRGESKSEGIAAPQVIYMDRAGQSYLAIFKMQPSVSRAGKNKIFEPNFYGDIYEKSQPWQLVVAHEIHRMVQGKAYQAKKVVEEFSTQWRVLSYGMFHISRITWWVMNNDSEIDLSDKKALVQAIKDKDNLLLEKAFNVAVGHLNLIVEANVEAEDQANNYFKSGSANTDINKYLKLMES